MSKKQFTAPIDNPLAKGYLREFDGWATAYPPDVSDPTGLRVMENLYITREKAVAVRPGLKPIFGKDDILAKYGLTLVGEFEHFYTNKGKKAILFATREPNNSVFFRAGIYNEEAGLYSIVQLTDPELGFEIDGTQSSLSFSKDTTYVRYVQIDNKIFALSNAGESMRLFYVGEHKRAKRVNEVTVPKYSSEYVATILHPTESWINSHDINQLPTKETPGSGKLVDSDPSKNTYNYGVFYTFFNEIGESEPSQVSVLKVARAQSAWRMQTPAGLSTTDPSRAKDQLAVIIPEKALRQAELEGALGWNLYAFTWTDQAPLPVDALRVGQRLFKDASNNLRRYQTMTALVEGRDTIMALPNATNRFNFTTPSAASQGLVVGDRIVLVHDIKEPAKIRWSSNQQGSYTDFSSTLGGGFKTLTSGNLQIPAAIVLWQNPQSVDTITILCSGVDGDSTSYYMSPNTQVAVNSSAVQVMGFEETTATPGTVSPYGVQVVNNALYHPLDSELMKSTAANYNISHSSMTELIQNEWEALINKQNIVAAQLDNRLYYLVHNLRGEKIKRDCMGNEVWVYDTITSSWSRWLVQGLSLQKIEINGRLLMSVSTPDNIYVFDPRSSMDEVLENGSYVLKKIEWELQTQLQGANRAHDVMAYLKQIQVSFGNFQGKCSYGIQGVSDQGRQFKRSTVFQSTRKDSFDSYKETGVLQIDETAKEWFFFATNKGFEDLIPSKGQISFVQVRLIQLSVNEGNEYGYIGSSEKYSSGLDSASRYYNGIPAPTQEY